MEFLTFLIRGLPLVGGLVGKGLDAFTTYTNKRMDSDLEKYKTDGKIDVDVITARTNLIAQMKEDPASKWGRRLIIYPWGLWFTAVSIRSIMQHSPWADYTWVVAAYPDSLNYIGYAIIAYLLGTAYRGNRAGR